jgi:hypothetical protein
LKNVDKDWHFLAAPICWCLQPHFHHNSTTFYQPIHHVLHTKKNGKTPCKNATPPQQKKITKCTAKDPDP